MATTTPQPDGPEEFVSRYSKFRNYPGRGSLQPAARLSGPLLRHYWEDVLDCPKPGQPPNQPPSRPPLFIEDDKQKVAFREVDEHGKVTKYNCLSEDDMRLYLFKRSTPPSDADCPVERADPRCRFVFLLNNERGEPLQISRTSLQRLLTFHQVSPTFLDILGDYRGTWSDERELRSTSFRTSMIPLEPPKSAVIPSLFRTGRRYQMSFDLKIPKELKSGGKELKSGGKELKSGEKEIKSGEKELKSGGKFYKVRQVALHHQFDVESGVQLWIVGDPYGLVKNRVQGYLPMKGCTATFGDLQASFRSSLEIHLEILGMAAEMWSQYTKDAEENVQDMTEIILRLRDPRFPVYKLPHDGEMQVMADQASQALIMLASNERVVGLLEAFYEQVLKDAGLEPETLKQCQHSIAEFRTELGDLKSQYEMQMDHMRALRSTIQGRKEIVVQQWQNNSAITMGLQGVANGNASAMMGIITVITLFYLPPTFASTFFSMDVFKDVDVSTWAKVTFPLLAVTITFAIIASWWVIGKFRAAHIGLMGEVTEDVVPPESRIDSIKNRLRSALSFWSGDDDVDRGDRGGRESKGDIKKALLGISRWFLPRNRETTDGIRDVEMGFKAESVGTLSLR